MNQVGYLISFIIGLVLFVFGFYYLAKSRKIKHWPRAQAKVLSRQVILSQQPAAIHDNEIAKYEVAIEFEYVANGQKLQAANLYPSHHLYSQKRAAKVLAELPPSAMIYYNPDKPEEAYFLAEPYWISVVIVISGFVLLLLGLPFFF
ncbi:TPA: hypothetical protein DF272_01350 [Candidatus Falkowbacteria bacterium]|nr:hypothetical protein [Candidatus Falkowbacteria bacterium]